MSLSSEQGFDLFYIAHNRQQGELRIDVWSSYSVELQGVSRIPSLARSSCGPHHMRSHGPTSSTFRNSVCFRRISIFSFYTRYTQCAWVVEPILRHLRDFVLYFHFL